MARRVTYLERPGGYNEGWDPDAKADLEMSSGMIVGPKVCTTGKIKSGISSMSSLILNFIDIFDAILFLIFG